MTSLKGLLDGETASALQGLFGVSADDGSENEAVTPPNQEWSNYENDEPSEHCDRCGHELKVEEIPEESTTREVLCGSCDRHRNTHAVGRFLSTEDVELD